LFVLVPVTRRKLGLPATWLLISAWLICARNQELPPSNRFPDPKKKFPEIPVLKSYRGSAPENFWQTFPHHRKKKFAARLKTKALARLIQICWWDWDRHQRRDAKIALRILKKGAITTLTHQLGPLNTKNAASAAIHCEFLTDNIAKWVSGGVVAGPFRRKPLRNFRVNPLMAVQQKGKIRPILNLSSPKGSSFNDAVNELRLKKLTMSSARIFANEIVKMGKGAVFAKYDFSDAYKLIAGNPEQWHCFGFKWLGRYFFDITTVFGSKSAPENFDYLPKTLVNIASSLSKVPKRMVFRQLDDVPVIGSKESKFAERFAAEYVRVCEKVGVPLAEICPNREKAFGPGKTGTVLGINFDSEKMTWNIPEDKFGRIIDQIEKFENLRSCSVKEAQKLHGQLNDLAMMFDFAKGFRFNIVQLLAKFEENENGRRFVTAALKNDLKIWRNLAGAARNGLPLPEQEGNAPVTALKFVSDAAGAAFRWENGERLNVTVANDRGVASIGYDGDQIVYAGGYKWPFELLTRKTDAGGKSFGFKSTFLETVGLILPFVTEPELVRGRHVVLQVDNLAVVYAWKKRYCKNDAETSLLIRVLHTIEAKLECKIYCEHLPRKSCPAAILADHLSRESTTTKKELDMIKHVQWRSLRGRIRGWLDNPVLDWNLPIAVCNKL